MAHHAEIDSAMALEARPGSSTDAPLHGIVTVDLTGTIEVSFFNSAWRDLLRMQTARVIARHPKGPQGHSKHHQRIRCDMHPLSVIQ